MNRARSSKNNRPLAPYVRRQAILSATVLMLCWLALSETDRLANASAEHDAQASGSHEAQQPTPSGAVNKALIPFPGRSFVNLLIEHDERHKRQSAGNPVPSARRIPSGEGIFLDVIQDDCGIVADFDTSVSRRLAGRSARRWVSRSSQG